MTIHYLSVQGVGERIGISPVTVRSYVAKGMLPAPDALVGDDAHQVRGWLPETIDAWQASRPGPGRWGPRQAD